MAHLVTAARKPHRLDEVEDALKGIGIQGLAVSHVVDSTSPPPGLERSAHPTAGGITAEVGDP